MLLELCPVLHLKIPDVSLTDRPAKIIKPLEDVEVKEGAHATLKCQLDKPDVVTEWYKNGEKLEPDGKRVQIAVNGKFQKLTVEQSELDDEAEYMCKVGEYETKCKLTVKGQYRVVGCRDVGQNRGVS